MRKLAYFALSFAAAIFIGEYLMDGNTPLIFSAACLVAVLFAFITRDKMRLRILLISVGLAAGFLYCFVYSAIFVSPNDVYNGYEGEMSFTVNDYPEKTDYGERVEVVFQNSKGRFVKARLYLYYDIPEDLAPGDVISLPVSISLADKLYGEKTDIFYSKGIVLFAYQDGEVNVDKGSERGLKYYPSYIGLKIKEKIAEIFPSDTAPFVTAILTGDTSMLNSDETLTSNLKISGIYHIVAVSGMHISFLVAFCILITGNKRRGAVLIFPVLFLFMAIAGFRPSVVRAGIMQMMLISAYIFNRENDPITSISTALMVLLFINPTSCKDVGLQLSFAATFGIILLTPRINMSILSRLRSSRLSKSFVAVKIINPVSAAFSASVGATVFTIPLVSVYFGYVSLVSPITNVLIFWAISLAFCGSIVACLVGFVLPAAGIAAAFIISFVVRYITLVSDFLASFRFSAIYVSNPFVAVWIALLYTVIIFAVVRKFKLRNYFAAGCYLAAVLCIILVFSPFMIRENGKIKVTAIDVGQGSSTVMTYGDYTVLVDCGSSSISNSGDVVADYLTGYSCNRIDILLLTHYHQDHIDGVPKLLDRMEVGLIVMPEPLPSDMDAFDEISEYADEHDVDILEISESVDISLGESRMTVIEPLGAVTANERGISVLYSIGDYDILITGDMEADTERKLVSSVELPDIELLIAGHHGSDGANSELLLKALKPEIAVISVGVNNYGHPGEETLKRFEIYGVEVYRTDMQGSIVIISE